MYEIILLLVGAVIGAIVSIALDRVLRHWFEQVPRLEGTSGGFMDVIGDGLSYTIENVGAASVPEFDIVLQHSSGSTLRVFETKQTGELLPSQKREFRMYVRNKQSPQAFKKFLKAHFGKKIEASEVDFARGMEFRLQIKHSERPIFQSPQIGEVLGAIIYRNLKLAGEEICVGGGYEEDLKLRFSQRPFWNKAPKVNLEPLNAD